MDSPEVAIIIPFVSINSYVIECVIGCLNLDYENFKIILLPDNKIILPTELHDKKIEVFETGNETIAKKRNMGIKICRNVEYYAFIDSDAFPRNDWLKKGIHSFSISKEIWAVGGPNITPENEGIMQRAVGNSQKSILVSGLNAFRKKIANDRMCSDLPTCNLIVKQDVFKELKGFNEALITGEDIDLCSRIVKKGKKIFYCKDVIVYHHNRSLFKPYFLQRFTYGLSVFKLAKEDFTFNKIYMFLPLLFILSIIFLGIFAIFSKDVLLVLFGILAVYFIITIFESIKYSDLIKELPLTFIAILIGNLGPAFGSLFALFNIKIDIKKIYKNAK